MPEGKKKDSFTFSDKIKNSKPAGSKSFANRIFSKIGKDGKPRQTLYQRTRRDAPFFIAAVLALLLLPFLYKYSGSVTDEDITPIKGDLIQDGDARDGYYSFVDSGSTLAPYPGNDTALLLVKPFSGEDSEAVTSEEVPDVNVPYVASTRRDSYADATSKKTASKLRDKETNILNEYRKRAAATTRKAFTRTPTKINQLGSAGMRRPNGSKLGVNMWGGGLKNAANKVKPNTPNEGPKPVSLQPLTAAGKPSRASFGQGHLAAAQKSKDAMSKGNPLEALRDAQVRAVGPNRVGGMDFDRGAFGPGGAGQTTFNMSSQAQRPWWWDEAKTRMHETWQRMFDYQWGWIDWATDLLRNILGGVLNCLITGQDDGSMGSMFGTAAGGSTKEPTCCGVKEAKWVGFAGPDVPFNKATCQGFAKSHKNLCSVDWKEPVVGGSSGKVGFFRQRAACLGVALNAKGEADIEFEPNRMCNLFKATNGQNFFVNPVGEARNWNSYIYVLAGNKVPQIVRENLKTVKKKNITGKEFWSSGVSKRGAKVPTSGTNSSESVSVQGKTVTVNGRLCDSSNFSITTSGRRATNGIAANEMGAAAKDATDAVKTNHKSTREAHELLNTQNDSNVFDWCVIAVEHGTEFDLNSVRTQVVNMFKSWFEENGSTHEKCSADKPIYDSKAEEENKCISVQKGAERAFAQLELKRVEAMVSKQKLAAGSHKLYWDALPMPYGVFREAYIRHSDVPDMPTRGIGIPLDKFKLRTEYENRLWGSEDSETGYGEIGCNWENRVSVSCEDVAEDAMTDTASAVLSFVNLSQNNGGYNTGNVVVQATLEGEDGITADAGNVAQFGKPYTFETLTEQGIFLPLGKYNVAEGQEAKQFTGHVTWKVFARDGGAQLDSATCAFRAEAVPPTKETDEHTETTVPRGSTKIIPDDYDGPCEDIQGYVVNSYWAAKYGSEIIAAHNSKEADESKRYLWDEGAKTYTIGGKSFTVSENDGEKEGFYPFGVGTNELPTLAEFVTALQMAQKEGLNTNVPKNAVCALGGLLTTASKDTTFLPTAHITDPKLQTNGFGAFLAYIGDSAVFWPSPRTPNGKNPRFIGLGSSATVPQAYHWGNYIRTKETKDSEKSAYYVVGLYPGYFTQSNNPYPLKDMIFKGGHASFAEYNLVGKKSSALDKPREDYTKFFSQVLGQHNNYNAAAQLGDMCRNADNTAWLYPEDETIPAANVLEYLNLACDVNRGGLSFKPWGRGDQTKPNRGTATIKGNNTATGAEQEKNTRRQANVDPGSIVATH